jgi:TolB protein
VEIRMPRRWLVPFLVVLPMVLASCFDSDPVTPDPEPQPPPAPPPGYVRALVWSSNRDGNWEIYAAGDDGDFPRRETNNPAQDTGPDYTRHGHNIAFVSDRDGNKEIYILHPYTGVLRRLTNNSVSDDQPDWSPDGSKIAFVREVSPGHQQIFVMNADGSNQVNISNSPKNDIQPDWRPAIQNQIAFASDRDAKYGANTYLEIYKMNADGSSVTRLTQNDDGVDYYPQWSPDGVLIAFTTHRADLPQCYSFALEVFTMEADGSDQTNVSNNCRGDAGATWRNNFTLFLLSDRDAQTQYAWDLYRVGLGGTGTGERLTTSGKEAGPKFHPFSGDF